MRVCACLWRWRNCKTEKDEHLQLYEDMPESDMPIHVEETAKQKKIREKHKGDK